MMTEVWSKVSTLKLYLPKQKSTIKEVLIFLKIALLIFCTHNPLS